MRGSGARPGGPAAATVSPPSAGDGEPPDQPDPQTPSATCVADGPAAASPGAPRYGSDAGASPGGGNARVFCRNLPMDYELSERFGEFGEVVKTQRRRARGYGFVEFARPESATKAVAAMDGSPLPAGKRLHCYLASSPKPSPAARKPRDDAERGARNGHTKDRGRQPKSQRNGFHTPTRRTVSRSQGSSGSRSQGSVSSRASAASADSRGGKRGHSGSGRGRGRSREPNKGDTRHGLNGEVFVGSLVGKIQRLEGLASSLPGRNHRNRRRRAHAMICRAKQDQVVGVQTEVATFAAEQAHTVSPSSPSGEKSPKSNSNKANAGGTGAEGGVKSPAT